MYAYKIIQLQTAPIVGMTASVIYSISWPGTPLGLAPHLVSPIRQPKDFRTKASFSASSSLSPSSSTTSRQSSRGTVFHQSDVFYVANAYLRRSSRLLWLGNRGGDISGEKRVVAGVVVQSALSWRSQQSRIIAHRSLTAVLYIISFESFVCFTRAISSDCNQIWFHLVLSNGKRRRILILQRD